MYGAVSQQIKQLLNTTDTHPKFMFLFYLSLTVRLNRSRLRSFRENGFQHAPNCPFCISYMWR